MVVKGTRDASGRRSSGGTIVIIIILVVVAYFAYTRGIDPLGMLQDLLHTVINYLPGSIRGPLREAVDLVFGLLSLIIDTLLDLLPR